MAAASLRIGLDFDNTIVCYDKAFHLVALEQNLIPCEIPVTKEAVRDYLRKMGREEDWTRLQGYVYGARMRDAHPFEGFFDFLLQARRNQWKVCIISHKTRTPYLGPAYDLHQAALQWMEDQGFFNPSLGGFGRDAVFFELTKQEKLKRVAHVGCDIFIDDLPELLADPAFPPGVRKVLFSPLGGKSPETHWATVRSWEEFSRVAGGDLS